jgi:hypothetical protein
MGQFNGLEGLAVDLDGYVYLTDQEMIVSGIFSLVDNRLTQQI